MLTTALTCNSFIFVDPQSIPLQVVQHALRAGLPFIAIASVVLIAGVISIVLSQLRSRDRLLLWLGIFALLYGVRLLFENDLIRAATGADDQICNLCTLVLTYIIPIPYAAFSRELLGSGWKKSISIWLWVQIVFAPTAISATVLWPQIRWTDFVNGWLIIAGTSLLLLHIFLIHRSEAAMTVLKWPLLVCGVLVLLTNLGVKPAGIDIEPLGFVTLLGGLAYTAARRAITREQKLAEIEQELTTARRIQASILPQNLPHLAALQIATRYQPMTAVAGDFYDFLKTGESCLTILVADVSGHGVPAALVASMLKVCFASQQNHAHDPAKVLAGLNGMLRGVLAGQYVTAACASIDLSQRTVTYAGAGHPPALLFRRNDHNVVQLAENGLFIGPFPHATYTSITAPFEPGDRLLLYTDGIIEATAPDGEQFGRERLMDFVLSERDLQPISFVERLFAKIASTLQEDDLTVVLAQMD